MKDFPGGGNTVQQQYFGWRLSQARMVIECAFGRLKARFGILKREMTWHVANWKDQCELEREPLTDEDIARAVEYEREFQPPIVDNRYSLGNNDEAGGQKVRSIFVKYFD